MTFLQGFLLLFPDIFFFHKKTYVTLHMKIYAYQKFKKRTFFFKSPQKALQGGGAQNVKDCLLKCFYAFPYCRYSFLIIFQDYFQCKIQIPNLKAVFLFSSPNQDNATFKIILSMNVYIYL